MEKVIGSARGRAQAGASRPAASGRPASARADVRAHARRPAAARAGSITRFRAARPAGRPRCRARPTAPSVSRRTAGCRAAGGPAGSRRAVRARSPAAPERDSVCSSGSMPRRASPARSAMSAALTVPVRPAWKATSSMISTASIALSRRSEHRRSPRGRGTSRLQADAGRCALILRCRSDMLMALRNAHGGDLASRPQVGPRCVPPPSSRPRAAASTAASSRPSAARRWCALPRLDRAGRAGGRLIAEAGVLQPARLGEGPHRPGDAGGRRARRADPARPHRAGRADLAATPASRSPSSPPRAATG